MEIRRRIVELLGTQESPVVFDIGAHWCEDSRWFLEHLKTPQVFAFEPDPRNVLKIRQTKANVGLQFFPWAISHRDGVQRLHLSSNKASSSLTPPKEHLKVYTHVTFGATIPVPTITLDTFCRLHKVPKIDFIWMDVQGAEESVFRGGRRMLPSVHYLYTEYANVPLYEGSKPLTELMTWLPGFELVEDYRSWSDGGDALLVNTAWQG